MERAGSVLKQLVFALLALEVAAGCVAVDPEAATTSRGSPGPTSALDDDVGNFHLYVSNQSFDIDPVDIQVYIDGDEVVNGIFSVESQHTWILFDLDLDVGEHTVRAVGHNGQAELTGTFLVTEEHWGLVEFWANPTEAPEQKLTFYTQDEPIGFA